MRIESVVLARRAAGLALAILALRLLALPVHAAEPGERPFAVVDLHVDLSYQVNFRGRSFADGSGQFRAADLARAGVVGAVLPLFVPRDASPSGPRIEDLESSYARVYGALAATDPYRLPGCIPRAGGVRTWLAFEGAGQLAAEPGALVAWAARGVRVVGPVHTESNALASSSRDANPSYGLTAAGRDFARLAARLGMAVDVSHASDRATRELLELARAERFPVVATHSNARALADHPRNLRDAELRGIAESGGVVGVNFHGPFLNKNGATLADAVRQVRYLARLIGPEHVAIGADFEGDTRPPAELSDVNGYQRLARALLDAKLPRADVRKIMAENALRVLCRGGDSD
ncbi:MAG TPA: membrane dipeptidase [Polyangiaceae bacterium]